MRAFLRRRIGRLGDGCILVVLGVAAALLGWWAYYEPGAIRITENVWDFEPAALWASGHGYSRAQEMPPALEEFLSGRAVELKPEDLPPAMSLTPADSGDAIDRIYLQYSVGIIWRLWGIRWDHVPILIGIGTGLMTVLIYAVFRLGMCRSLSVLGTLLAMSSPLMRVMLPWLRDFWKGPFVLVTILAVGYLISRPIRTRSLLVLSCLLGIAVGIGYGFRQDCIICLPPALIAVGLCSHGGRMRKGLPVRALSALLVIGGFGLAASPVLTALWNNRGPANYVYLLQGHSTYCQHALGMRRGFYRPIAVSDDAFLVANTLTYNARTISAKAWGQEAANPEANPAGIRLLRHVEDAFAGPRNLAFERARAQFTLEFWIGAMEFLMAKPCALPRLVAGTVFGLGQPSMAYGYPDFGDGLRSSAKRLLFHLVSTFPADFLARCYAATAHTVAGMRAYAATPDSVMPEDGSFRGSPDNRGEPSQAWWGVHTHVGRHVQHYGLYYALAALAYISMGSVWKGLGVFAVLLYFSGYVGLFYQDRHTYHLVFVGYWFPAFCLEHGSRTVFQAISRVRPGESALAENRAPSLRSAVRNAAVFLMAAALTVSLPLCALRLWQHARVMEIRERYEDATLEPLPCQENIGPDGTIFYSTTPLHKRPPLPRFLRLPWEVSDPLFLLAHDYYAVEFEVPEPITPLTMRALYRDCQWDCICSIRDDFDEVSRGEPIRVRYFFPAFEFAIGEHHPFVGFVLPSGAVLKGLYRVQNQEEFPLPMNLWLVDGAGPPRWYQGIPLFGTWL